MLSRREWIERAFRLVGLVGLTRRGEAAENASKVSKETAKYQDHPNGAQICGKCRFYVPPGGQAGSGMMGGPMGPGMMGGQKGPGMMGGQMGPGMMAAGACELVEGRISPMGWCVLYRPLEG